LALVVPPLLILLVLIRQVKLLRWIQLGPSLCSSKAAAELLWLAVQLQAHLLLLMIQRLLLLLWLLLVLHLLQVHLPVLLLRCPLTAPELQVRRLSLLLLRLLLLAVLLRKWLMLLLQMLLLPRLQAAVAAPADALGVFFAARSAAVYDDKAARIRCWAASTKALEAFACLCQVGGGFSSKFQITVTLGPSALALLAELLFIIAGAGTTRVCLACV